MLVGDARQLPELAAGGAFHGLIQRGFAVELRDNVRQVNEWERRALDDLRAGQAGKRSLRTTTVARSMSRRPPTTRGAGSSTTGSHAVTATER